MKSRCRGLATFDVTSSSWNATFQFDKGRSFLSELNGRLLSGRALNIGDD